MAADPNANIHYLIEAYGNLDCAHWADGPFCPHCGEREAIRVLHGQTTRPGIYHCLTCRKRFAGMLDILFQDAGARRRPAKPLIWLGMGPYEGPRHGLFGRGAFAVWYLAHIIRQMLIGSDAKPPG